MDSIENLLIVEAFLFMQGLYGHAAATKPGQKSDPFPALKKPLLPNEPSFVDQLKKREEKFLSKIPGELEKHRKKP